MQNATDHAEFKPMVEQVERNLGNLPKEGSADAGYSSYDNLEYAEVNRVGNKQKQLKGGDSLQGTTVKRCWRQSMIGDYHPAKRGF